MWLPLAALSPWWALFISAVVFGVLMVFAYGYVSNQSAIRRVKNDITSYILETFLFRYDTVLSLKAQLKLFFAGAKYAALALGPILILAVPCIFLLAHMNLRLGYRPLHPGESKLLSVELERGSNLQGVSIVALNGSGVTEAKSSTIAINGIVRTPKESRAVGRVVALEAGVQTIVLPGGETSEVVVDTKEGSLSRSTARPLGVSLTRNDWLTAFLSPNGAARQVIESKEVSSVFLTYPERDYELLGMQLTWILPFLVISIVAGFIGSKFLGIAV